MHIPNFCKYLVTLSISATKGGYGNQNLCQYCIMGDPRTEDVTNLETEGGFLNSEIQTSFSFLYKWLFTRAAKSLRILGSMFGISIDWRISNTFKNSESTETFHKILQHC